MKSFENLKKKKKKTIYLATRKFKTTGAFINPEKKEYFPGKI